MQIDKASTQDAAGRVLSQGSVDGFWIFLVFGLLFFFPLSVGLVGSKINLSLYDVLLPLIFFFELVRGRIWWPGRKIVLLFLLPILAIGLHSVLTGVFLDGVHLTPLLRQVAFFADIGMLVLLFQLPERRCPSSGVLLALLFMAGAYALTMRNMEGHYADWAIHETIYAAIVTGLLLLFLFLQSREEKPANFLKPMAAIVTKPTTVMATAQRIRCRRRFGRLRRGGELTARRRPQRRHRALRGGSVEWSRPGLRSVGTPRWSLRGPAARGRESPDGSDGS